MTTCSPLSMRTLKQRDDVKKLKNQNTHTGQETHYEQYKTSGMTMHDMNLEENDNNVEKNIVEHDMKVQKHHYVKGIKHYIKCKDDKDLRQRGLKQHEYQKYEHKKHDLQKDDHRKQQQQQQRTQQIIYSL
eukprot:5743035-Amphidinium_carterae.1